ncbi:SDR family oxidoreductase [Kushneria phosphatilytica]|uniref:SDR family oxidoreductase n=1 Tax=Kushneria phosphatilytica TaxID=657387 RepID=A0A1S1NT30_9GAMM|nr:SDR family oxidoreductase [Kushneria phosphatilytica]OHV08763.1 short-chain dehydrogenase [Kushneria phosphatilytica]QEL12482.1 SDR family oxidoreductase [Kushneria phosphatilytica]
MSVSKRQEVVVITGAGAGLGRATAREFARRGAHLGLISRDETRLAAVKSEAEALGARVVTVAADVADAAQIEAAADRIESELGPLDIWVNDAMTTVFSPLHAMTAEEFKRVTEVTYLGNVNGTMAALKRMRPRDHGTIVQVGSALAYRPVPLQTAYCGAKHAIKGYTEGLRCELLNEGSRVHVTIVEMPGLNTPQFDWCRSHLSHRARPVAPVYQPEVGARAIYWAAHHRRRQLYVGIPSVLTIWGNKLMPGLMDRYLARNAVSGQQTATREDPDRADNLWQPVPGDKGAHGRFNRESHASSAQLWAATHRREIGLVAGAAVVLGAVLGSTGRARRRRVSRR